MPRPPVKKRKLPQPAEDVVSGGRELIRLGKVGAEKVKSGYQKLKKFVSKGS